MVILTMHLRLTNKIDLCESAANAGGPYAVVMVNTGDNNAQSIPAV